MRLVHDSRDHVTRHRAWTNSYAREELGRLMRHYCKLKRENRYVPQSMVDTINGLKRQLGII